MNWGDFLYNTPKGFYFVWPYSSLKKHKTFFDYPYHKRIQIVCDYLDEQIRLVNRYGWDYDHNKRR